MYLLAKKLGFAELMFKNIKVENNLPVAEDILREINRGGWSTGYCGQSPERLKAHMKNQDKFDLVTLRAPANLPDIGGDYYGLPWPCWGTARVPSSRNAYALQYKPCGEGRRQPVPCAVWRRTRGQDQSHGERCRGREGREIQPARRGSYPKDLEIKDGYPEFTFGVLKKLGWDKDLTEAELCDHPACQSNDARRGFMVDRSVRRHPARCDYARMYSLRQWQGARECVRPYRMPFRFTASPICTPRPDLVAEIPTLPNARQFRMPNIGFDVQKAAVEKGDCQTIPDHPHLWSPWLSTKAVAKRPAPTSGSPNFSRTCSLRLILRMRQNAASGDAAGFWVTGAEYNFQGPDEGAWSRSASARGVAWCPFHFAGWFEGVDQRNKYPQGRRSIVLGESVNTLTTYGFDPVTGMQEPKATLCQIRAA